MVIGATGAVGSSLTRSLLASPAWHSVTILTRATTPLFSGAPGADKLIQRVVDPEQLDQETRLAAEGCDAAFCTMGIGQPRKVPREEFWKVDVVYAGRFARACRAAGVRHFSLLSSVGANPLSRNYYLHVKGSAETWCRAAEFARVSLFRPSLLVTRQIRYGAQDWIAQTVFPPLSWALPRRFHQIAVEELGRAMCLNAEREGTGVEVLHYPEFRALLRPAGRN